MNNKQYDLTDEELECAELIIVEAEHQAKLTKNVGASLTTIFYDKLQHKIAELFNDLNEIEAELEEYRKYFGTAAELKEYMMTIGIPYDPDNPEVEYVFDEKTQEYKVKTGDEPEKPRRKSY